MGWSCFCLVSGSNSYRYVVHSIQTCKRIDMKEWYNEQIVGPIREFAKNHGSERSPQWNSVRKEHIRYNCECVVCGTKKGLQVHHVIPFHVMPEEELNPKNLITLCAKHHFLFGHLNYWKSWNPNVRQDSIIWQNKLDSRP